MSTENDNKNNDQSSEALLSSIQADVSDIKKDLHDLKKPLKSAAKDISGLLGPIRFILTAIILLAVFLFFYSR